MAKEAFSWLLKDLRAQICSLLLEFLYLVDGGLLSNTAHEAFLRSSRSSSKGGKRTHSSSSSSSSGAGEDAEDTPVGASATLIEAKQQEVTSSFQGSRVQGLVEGIVPCGV